MLRGICFARSSRTQPRLAPRVQKTCPLHKKMSFRSASEASPTGIQLSVRSLKGSTPAVVETAGYMAFCTTTLNAPKKRLISEKRSSAESYPNSATLAYFWDCSYVCPCKFAACFRGARGRLRDRSSIVWHHLERQRNKVYPHVCTVSSPLDVSSCSIWLPRGLRAGSDKAR